jgi:hypothetical protein
MENNRMPIRIFAVSEQGFYNAQKSYSIGLHLCATPYKKLLC